MLQFQWEPLNHLLANDLAALGARSWREAGYGREVLNYDPNWPRYARAEASNDMRIMAVREDHGLLVGYATVFVGENLYDRKIVHAMIQDIYLEPESRQGFKTFSDFMDKIVEQMRLIGVQMITIGEPEDNERGAIGSVYRRYGFKPEQRLWTFSVKGAK